MSKVEFALVISMNVFWLGLTFDRYWFETSRLVERFISKAKREGRCPICKTCITAKAEYPIEGFK